MNILSYASLRFPASLAAGALITATLFWTLWALTDATFEVIEADRIRIDFTRVVRIEDSPKKERVRPEREEIEQAPPLRISGPISDRTGDISPGLVMNDRPVVDLPSGGGIAMGRDTDVVPLVRVNPTYPPREAARGIEGWVLVQFDITASGSVTNVVAVDSEPGTAFDKAATEAVARWRYNPSVVNGKSVERIGMQTKISFTLAEE